MPIASSRLALAALLALTLLLGGGAVQAEEPVPPTPCPSPDAVAPKPPAPSAAPAPVDPSLVDPSLVDPALARARTLRAGLAAPGEAWQFEGDLFGLGHRLGTVSWSAEPGTYGDAPCWIVNERSVREAGKGRVVSELLAFLAPDLSVLRGESLHKAPGGGSVTSFGWRDGAMEVVEQGDGGNIASATPAVAPGATMGMFALLRVLAALPKDATGTWRLQGFDPRFAFGDDKGKPIAPDLADLVLTVVGPATIYDGPALSLPRRTFAVRAKAGWGRELVLHLHPETRALLGVDGVLPGLHVRPRGVWREVGPPPWFDRVGQPSVGPFEAFVAFGRGYHLPKRDLLEAAFHWPSMRDVEVAAGSYAPDVALERVRDDWVAEFERMSKHRSEGDCDDLLIQLMASAEIRTNDDGSVTIDTLPAFGDHAYTMAEREGRWWIVKVD
jgi:hypothetical protein